MGQLEKIALGVRFDTVAPEVAANIEAYLSRVAEFQETV